MTLTRRQLLKNTGWLAAGITVTASTGCSLLPALPTFGVSSAEDSLMWVQLTPDGRVDFFLPRAELGQGVADTFSLVVAEELFIDPGSVTCLHQSTDVMAPCQMTVGSQSVENYFLLVAQAAAYLRHTIQLRLSEQLKVPYSTLSLVTDGFRQGASFYTYAEIVRNHEGTIVPLPDSLPENHSLEIRSQRPVATLDYLGRTVFSARNRRIVTGKETYSRDVRIENMHYGAVAHPPHLGALLTGFNTDAAMQVKGVVSVITHKGEVGIVAKTPLSAIRGLEALAPDWSPLSKSEADNIDQVLDVDRYIAAAAFDHEVVNQGSVSTGQAAARYTLNRRYDSPMAAHCAMEPRSGVAHWQIINNDARCAVWTGSQDAWAVRASISKSLSIPEANITVHNHSVGGAFGGRVMCQASLEAAWLSQQSQLPIKVQWSREDEFRYNYVGPQFSSRISAGVDEQGLISHWQQSVVASPILTSSLFVPKDLYWVANFIPDPGTKRGMQPPYEIQNMSIEFADERLPMPTGPWRGLGAAPNTFAVELAIDELAALSDTDPLTFRQINLKDQRLNNCLDVLRNTLALPLTSYGIASTIYKGVTRVAIAARWVEDQGSFRLAELICVQDCGRILAPDKVRAQIQGNLIWGIGMATSEKFILKNGTAATVNFDTYIMPRQHDIPAIEIILIDSLEASSGVAEASFAPAAAAIVNGLYAASGQRHYALPVTQ